MERSTDYWKSQAAACQPALLADLAPLIAIESVCDESAATPAAMASRQKISTTSLG